MHLQLILLNLGATTRPKQKCKICLFQSCKTTVDYAGQPGLFVSETARVW